MGRWDNFDHLEDSLTLSELLEVRDAMYDAELRQIKAFGMMMGAEIDDGGGESDTTFDDVLKRAKEQAAADPNAPRDPLDALIM